MRTSLLLVKFWSVPSLRSCSMLQILPQYPILKQLCEFSLSLWQTIHFSRAETSSQSPFQPHHITQCLECGKCSRNCRESLSWRDHKWATSPPRSHPINRMPLCMAGNILLRIMNYMPISQSSLCVYMCLNVQLERHVWYFYPILFVFF